MSYDIGFLGGGQLARMSIQAAQRMGLTCLSLDPGEDTPAGQIAASIVSPLSDSDKIAELIGQCERVTLENEFVPADAVRQALERAKAPVSKMAPNVETLAVVQDKFLQRHALQQAGVPSPWAVALEGNADNAISEIGFPMVLKSRFGGYDGKGIRYVPDQEALNRLEPEWSNGGWMAEQHIAFERELAAMVYLSEWGAGSFPTMETVQKDHVCDLVFPSGVDQSKLALAAVEAIGGHGLFGVEMFELASGEALINEIAPRPHNTGHYSLDWGAVSQFEQHVRLVMGFPLETPRSPLPVCMANLLGRAAVNGDLREATKAALSVPGCHVHWYGKAECRPGRKMGHLNVVGAPGQAVDSVVDAAILARDRFFEAYGP